MIYIYVLKLKHNKFYIGKTTNPQFRLDNHFDSLGSEWTKKYIPLKLHELIPDQSNHDEQRITQEYMAKYGIDNVRGGPWCKVTLDTLEKIFIQRLLAGENDACFNCGAADHFVNDCPMKYKSNRSKKTKKSKSTWNCKFCDRGFDSCRGCTFHENVHCVQRKGKDKYYNPARALVDELRDFSSEEDDYEEYEDSYESEEDDYEEYEDSYGKSVQCFRCGRQGHYANKCYAKTHTKGYYLS